jgi:Putative restriction endonuclease
MSVAALNAPSYLAYSMFHRFSVAKYHRLTELGVLTEDDNVELLEGYVVQKMARNPPHCNALQRLTTRLFRLALANWQVRIQMAVTLVDSEPEPDTVLARGNEDAFAHRHPGPSDIGVVIEVSDTSLGIDRSDKGRIYARSNLPVYWIINVVDRQVEVYTDPRPNDPVPAYATRTDYRPGDAVPLILDGQQVARLPVDELLG